MNARRRNDIQRLTDKIEQYMTFAISTNYIGQSQHKIQLSQGYHATDKQVADKQVAVEQGSLKQNDHIRRLRVASANIWTRHKP